MPVSITNHISYPKVDKREPDKKRHYVTRREYKRGIPWTKAELELLDTTFRRDGAKVIAEKINRTVRAVNHMASMRKLTRK